MILAPVYKLNVLSDTAIALWKTFAGGNGTEAVLGLKGVGRFGDMRAPANLFDGSTSGTFFSRGNSITGSTSDSGLNTGFYVTAGYCASILKGFIMTTCNNNYNRSPLTLTIEGSKYVDNLNADSSWSLIYNGSSGLANTNTGKTDGSYQTVNAIESYKSYRFLVTTKRGVRSDTVCYSKVKLFGLYDSGPLPLRNSKSRNILSCEK